MSKNYKNYIEYKKILELLKFSSNFKIYIIVIFMLMFLSTGISLVTPILTGEIIDKAIGNENTKLLLIYGVLIITTRLVAEIINYISFRIENYISTQISLEKRTDLIKKLHLKEWVNIKDVKEGEIIQTLVADIDSISVVINSVIIRSVSNIITVFITIGYLFYADLRLTIIGFVYIPIQSYILKKFKRKIAQDTKNSRQVQSRLCTEIIEQIRGFKVIRALYIHDYMKERLFKLNRLNCDINRKSNKNLALFNNISNSSNHFFSNILLVIGGFFVINGTLSLGKLMAFGSLYSRLLGAVNQVLNSNLQLQKNFISLDKINKFCEDQSIDLEKGIRIQSISSIELRNLNFSYDSRNLINNLNYKMNLGDTVLICGDNGSGKSTLINLLLQNLKPTNGCILVNNNRIEEIQRNSLCSNIGVILQDDCLFTGTIYKNICVGREGIIEDKILRLIKELKLEKYFDRTTLDLSRELNVLNHNLSGGERQVISIIRALLTEPDVLIMDESTSGIDANSKRELLKNILNYRKNKINIIISHDNEDKTLFNNIIELE